MFQFIQLILKLNEWGKKSVAPQFRGASVVFLAVMVLQNKCFIKITVCVCVCVCC